MEIFEGFPLSHQQRRVWLWRDGGDAYRATALLRLTGSLDPEALREAVGEVLGRHEIFTTAFELRPGLRVPIQVPGRLGGPAWRALDLRTLKVEKRLAEVESLLLGGDQEGFDLACGPTVRCTLVALEDREHLLLFAMPALLADSEALRTLAEQVAEELRPAGREVDEPFQYIDFCDWQSALLADPDEDAQAGRSHWQQRAVDFAALEALKIPGEKPREPAGPFSVGRWRQAIDARLRRRLEAIAATAQVGPEVVIEACWVAFLGRLLEVPKVSIGHVVSGKQLDELADAIGPFAQQVPLSANTQSSRSLEALIAEVATGSGQAADWQEYFLAEDPPARLPWGFEAVALPSPLQVGELTVCLERASACAEPFVLKLTASLGDEGWSLELAYDARCFSARALERLGERFFVFLKNAADRPATPLRELEMLSQADREDVLAELSGERRDVSQPSLTPQLLPQTIARQAELHPDIAAVISGPEERSYADLWQRSGRLARLLRQRGVGPEVVVAVFSSRPLEVVVALIAIWRAGGAYLPLEPSLPAGRISEFLTLSGASLVLADEDLLANLPTDRPPTIVLTTDSANFADESTDEGEEAIKVAVRPENAAYVLFTSGSTGRPKAVVVEHRQVLNYAHGVLRRLRDLDAGAKNDPLEAGRRFALLSTFGADLGNTMIFSALCTGGTLIAPAATKLTDPEALITEFAARRPDYSKVVPSHLRALLASPRAADLLPRRGLVLGGEALTGQLLRQIRQLAPGLAVLNHYGPTETTVGVTTHGLAAAGAADRPDAEPLTEPDGPISLGRPLDNVHLYLLDPRGQLVAPGMRGEIAIGGANVSRGYLAARATAERFVPDPFGRVPGGRVYKTGDLASLRADGLIFAGRLDDQMKIRGFRVEPGEVERALTAHPDVREAAVVAYGPADGERRLVAYVVGEAPDAQKLRAHLRQTLPEPFVPSTFMTLAALPLNANGKLDRRALPEPKGDRTELGIAYVAPRNLAESAIVEIWKEVLALEKVGIYDNFFDLGGTSLAMIQAHGKLRERFPDGAGDDLTMVDLFRAPTIATIAQTLRSGRQTGTDRAQHQQHAQERLRRLQRQREVRHR